MNLFDNIFNPVNGFLGKQAQPQVPSFATPKAPRTTNYTQPIQSTAPVAKPTMTLFSDENEAFQKMKQANIQDEQAYGMLKKRRMDLLGGNDISEEEKSALQSMRESNVPSDKAVSMIQQRRKDQFQKKYDEGNLLQKGAYNALSFAAGNLETVAKYGGNTLDFITGGTMGFGDEVKKMEQVTQSPEFDSMAFKAGTYLPDVAMAVSPIGGGYLAGAKGMTGLQGANLFSKIGAKNLTQGLMGRSAVVGAGFGASTPILNEGNDATMGDIANGAGVGAVAGAVATPVIAKALKYVQAGYRGGLTGMGKSISRDIKGGVQTITPSGANISTRANRFNSSEIRDFKKMTGESPGEFATSRGMTKTGDDAVLEATNLWQRSKDQADEALKAIKGKFKFTGGNEDLLKTTLDDLDVRLTNTKSSDSARIKQLKAKYEDSGITMSEINEIKRAYSNNYKYSFVDAGSESALRSRNLQDAVRKWQFKVAEENGLTNLKEINKTTQGWKTFADSLSKKIQGSSGNNAVSLTDWIALSGGSPENIALYLGKKLASSDTVKRGAIKLFSKQTKPSIIQASKADIQQANFNKNVNRGVSGRGDNSGGKSMVRPVGLLPAASKEAMQAQEASLARGVTKKQSTEQAKKILKAEKANKEAIRSPDITTESKIVRPVPGKPVIKPTPVANTVKPASRVKEGGKSWEELNKSSPELFETGILRKNQAPIGVSKEDSIPKSTHSAQHTWQNYGQYDEFQASRLYDKKMHKYVDENGKYIEDSQGNILEDVWDDSAQEWIEPTIKNSDIRSNLLESFKTQEGSEYLRKVISAIPKDKNGYITAYRIGNIGGDGVQSYTLSEGMAKTFSNIGTDIVPSIGMKSGGYKDFGGLSHNIVKIDPKGIEAWSPYDAEILVSPKYVKVKPKPLSNESKVIKKPKK